MIPQHVAEESVYLYLSLQADDISSAEVENWLSKDELHQQAWAHIQATNKRLQTLSDPVARSTILTTNGKQRRGFVKSLAVLLFLGSSGGLAYRYYPLADITTGIGETSQIVLDNGSRLHLNTDTAVNIYVQRERIVVTLIKGEIVITTPESQSNLVARTTFNTLPLSVVTPQGELRPIGTKFSVRQFDDHADVSVFEGRVATFPIAKDRDDSVILDAGFAGKLLASGLQSITVVDENMIAWIDGMLVATSMPLNEFLASLSRYHIGYLACDPAISSIAISGTYPLDDIDLILESLMHIHPVSVQRITRYWVRLVPA